MNTHPVKWQNSEMFRCGDKGRHHILRRTDNQYLTIQAVGRKRMFYIWQQDIKGDMWVEVKDGVLRRILEQWEKVLAELPRLEFGDAGFFVDGDVPAGPMVQFTPQICYPGESFDGWLVKIHHCDDRYLVRFPVYGKQRRHFMDTHARLDEPMAIKFNKWEFQYANV